MAPRGFFSITQKHDFQSVSPNHAVIYSKPSIPLSPPCPYSQGFGKLKVNFHQRGKKKKKAYSFDPMLASAFLPKLDTVSSRNFLTPQA